MGRGLVQSRRLELRYHGYHGNDYSCELLPEIISRGGKITVPIPDFDMDSGMNAIHVVNRIVRKYPRMTVVQDFKGPGQL